MKSLRVLFVIVILILAFTFIQLIPIRFHLQFGTLYLEELYGPTCAAIGGVYYGWPFDFYYNSMCGVDYINIISFGINIAVFLVSALIIGKLAIKRT
ncbi:MAG: hypothetical protein A3I07_03415 [Candidatus Doudnabacteria bacterium RIFCSPLOWO2_02_FULL_42_9]|uniref:Uncharacterized protein n=1 Tax=Candidatus Doudnabacteria bacterium RIFCSPHIGHO2_01_FULL_41_86 TaxID=1817821 RepID=A0A1F5N826_9BACT|nr:MAG: hypothetical protein A2717_03845 [Candidatus Doudnabacteria bacterium RIFCSPHIGHO2_01_FULL_41_86]OGE74801.1 MAG: hypothetical protein A3K07_03435 [Candidatus Doudnabacteria bacterium RIFCSPHIGHO2_01_43_10]OGE85769.1 MAG: hypothetical protein A3E28_03175 [Candidatus Doudnabacteria bacterium RIFCSPHIGHO2_12_FULL_42_22]OGE87264.1 MAG: hypothetical protein A3C49_00800 [Candidatus Doudnabacteria bacterium RIFCSPHIGHO2_02_FULL_42_25]OGE92101.1 MAG: hypothetical protein A2895_00675 [Candidatus